MRVVLTLVVASFFASSAWGQEVVAIPFAPPTPSMFTIDEVRTRTFTESGRTQTRSGRVRSNLELRSREGGYDAVWTTISAEPQAIVIDNGGADPTLLQGRPIALSLDESGAPTGMVDWRGVRRGMFQIMLDGERDPFWRRAYTATERMMSEWSPEIAAPTLMETLSIMSMCHNTELELGKPLTLDAPLPSPLGGPPVLTRLTWALQAVDRSAGTARILHSRAPDIASANASAAGTVERLEVLPEEADDRLNSLGSRVECLVDLQSGMARTVRFNVRFTLGADTERRRREITVTPR
jgi:hypothetical protein